MMEQTFDHGKEILEFLFRVEGDVLGIYFQSSCSSVKCVSNASHDSLTSFPKKAEMLIVNIYQHDPALSTLPVCKIENLNRKFSGMHL